MSMLSDLIDKAPLNKFYARAAIEEVRNKITLLRYTLESTDGDLLNNIDAAKGLESTLFDLELLADHACKWFESKETKSAS